MGGGGKKKNGGKKPTAAVKAATSRSGLPSRGSVNAAPFDAVVPPLLQFERPPMELDAVDLHAGMILRVPDFLTARECARVRQFADDEGFARVTQRASKYYAFRDNDRLLLRMTAFAELLWTRLRPLVPPEYEGMHAVGLNPAVRFYRYNVGQRFGCHVDQSDVDPVTGFHSRFTVLVYLNDAGDSELQGGETIFYGNERDAQRGAGGRQLDVALKVSPETGAALVHGHGDRCLLHEGAEVTRGAKYLLRSDVMYSPIKPRN